MNAVRQPVELLEKNRPRQERAKRTYESILDAAAHLLVEVGVERISTNLIAERAGVTVPALYRYFPNKYAVLYALGAKLMDAQNEVAREWFLNNLETGDPASFLGEIYTLLVATYEVTREQVAGLEIIQSLRAVAPLREVRLKSHSLVAGQFASALAELLPQSDPDTLQMRARMSVDIGYGVIEMVLEDASLPAESVLQEGAKMIALYWQELLQVSG